MPCLATSDHLSCTACPLHEHRKQVVPGHGNPAARIMFVAEAPGEQEDLVGEPLVGPAGRKLDELLDRAGLRRDDLYLTNIVHCRPPGNDLRAHPQAILTCPPLWLHREIDEVKPIVLVAAGLTASARWFPGLTSMHDISLAVRAFPGEFPRYAVGCYHPSYALRSRERWVEESIVDSLRIAAELCAY